MAVAKPVRVLAALSLALFFFLVFSLLRSPPTLHTPGSQDGEIISKMERDPLLDRKGICPPIPNPQVITPLI
jgi:mannosyltransferase